MRLFLLICSLLTLLLGGCASTPVRHLASDAALITPGQSTRQDVLLYLGTPDGHRLVSPGVEELVYYEDRKGELARTKYIGGLIGTSGYEILLITLNGDKVTKSEFRTFDKDDQNWAKDFTWDEIP